MKTIQMKESIKNYFNLLETTNLSFLLDYNSELWDELYTTFINEDTVSQGTTKIIQLLKSKEMIDESESIKSMFIDLQVIGIEDRQTYQNAYFNSGKLSISMQWFN